MENFKIMLNEVQTKYENQKFNEPKTMNTHVTSQPAPQGQSHRKNQHQQPPKNSSTKGFKSPQNDESKNQNEAKKNSQHHQEKKMNQPN